MSRNPYAKHRDVDCSDGRSGHPFDFHDEVPVFGNNVDSIDDNLHEQLDFEYPEEQQEEKHRNTTFYC